MEKNARQVLHHPQKKNLLIKLSFIWLTLVIVGSIAVGMLIQFGLQNQSVVQKLLSQKVEEQTLNDKPLQLNDIRSEKFGYQLTYNPEIFKTDRATGNNQSDLSEVGLTTQDTIQTGFGFILFNAYSETELENIKKDQTITGKDDLEKAANWYQRKKLRDLTDTSTFVTKVREPHWGGDSYRFTYKRQLFGKDVFHYVYLSIMNNKLYTVLADYPKSGFSGELVESWIDEIKFLGPQTAEVKAETTSKKLDLDEVKLVELNKASVVQIVSINCLSIKVKDLSQVKVLKPSYELCSGGSGSGFMIGKDGLIGTNGHVVKPTVTDLVYLGRPEPGSRDFFIDFQKELQSQELPQDEATGSAQTTRVSYSRSPSTLDALIAKFNDYQSQGVLEKEEIDHYFVKLGNEPLLFNKATSANRNSFSYKNLMPKSRTPSILDAELIASDFSGLTALTPQTSDGTPTQRVKSSDVAIIKLKAENITEYPGVPVLSSTEVKEGQQIMVVGFPGLVSGQNPEAAVLLDETISSVRPTITRGIISAIKQDRFGQILLQTDSSIEHGNSGGPAFNYFGDVIGIATYVMTSGSGNYNFLRATDDLTKLWEANNGSPEEPSAAYMAWKSGLTFFWDSRFTKAKEQFETVKKLYPIHPQVDEYIANADQGIKDGQDVDLNPELKATELKSFGYTQQQIIIFIAIIMTVIIIIGGIMTTYFIYDHKKNMNVVIAVQAPSQTPGTSPTTKA